MSKRAIPFIIKVVIEIYRGEKRSLNQPPLKEPKIAPIPIDEIIHPTCMVVKSSCSVKYNAINNVAALVPAFTKAATSSNQIGRVLCFDRLIVNTRSLFRYNFILFWIFISLVDGKMLEYDLILNFGLAFFCLIFIVSNYHVFGSDTTLIRLF